MLRVDMSQRVNRLLPDFAIWLDNACYSAGLLDAAAVRGRQDRYILHVTEVASASHRDILIDYREGDASFLPAANGLPARIAFGETDKNFAYALIAELMRPESMPAVADAASAALMRLAMRVAASDATAFIQGETGTGKEGIARFLHAMSPRAEKDFIAVNCAALPETMMEAMLFGHRKGSFTGAGHSAEGLFHAANGGTLFLDEITELPLPLQAKLLRALQEGEILPVGATHPVPVDIRVIAAGNRDVALEAEAGRFRTDLYWRLNVMPIKLQPLAERPDDIPAIAASFLLRHFKAMPQSGLAWPSAAAMTALSRHRWPGNARELGNVLQRALLLREGSRITPRDLALEGALDGMMGHAPIAQNDRVSAPASLHDIARNSKLDAIRAALLDTGGHRARTARLLGISERTLRYRLAEMRDLAMAG